MQDQLERNAQTKSRGRFSAPAREDVAEQGYGAISKALMGAAAGAAGPSCWIAPTG